jgi:hypothetical protein
MMHLLHYCCSSNRRLQLIMVIIMLHIISLPSPLHAALSSSTPSPSLQSQQQPLLSSPLLPSFLFDIRFELSPELNTLLVKHPFFNQPSTTSSVTTPSVSTNSISSSNPKDVSSSNDKNDAPHEEMASNNTTTYDVYICHDGQITINDIASGPYNWTHCFLQAFDLIIAVFEPTVNQSKNSFHNEIGRLMRVCSTIALLHNYNHRLTNVISYNMVDM